MVGSRTLAALGYVTVRGVRGMGQSPILQLLAVGTISVCLVLLGLTLLMWTNVRALAHGWGVDVPMTVYLAEDAPDEDVADLIARVEHVSEVAAVEAITPEMAMDRLAVGLGGQREILEGLDAEVLPSSLEVHFADEAREDVGFRLARRLETFDAVEEVAVVGAWVGRVEELLATSRLLALGVGILVSLACMAIVWSTIRLSVFARRAEIEIFRLVGGTTAFVHGPFLVEGLVQGLLGATLAVTFLWLGFDLVRPILEQGLSLLLAAGAIRFFTPMEIAATVAFGGLLGVAGSRAAVARYAST